MEEMKHLDGFAPSAEDTAKLNEFVTWLVEHGFQGIVMIHKRKRRRRDSPHPY